MPSPGRRGPSRNLVIVGAVLVLAAVLAGLEVRDRSLYLAEEDARVRADMITVSSRVAGWITARPASEGQAVEKGTLLVTIDQRDAELALAELAAQRDAVRADQARLSADTGLARGQTDTRLQSARVDLEAAQVTVSSLEPQLRLAQSDFARTRRLYEQKMASQAARDQSEAQLQRIEREYRMAKAQLQGGGARVNEAAAERPRVAVLAAQMAVLDQRAAEIDARIRRQRLELDDRQVRSPSKGVIDRSFVAPGEYVGAGQRLLLMHDPAAVWIEVNVKETQLRRLARGQKVRVRADAWPGEEFEGTVERIGEAATSTFALLPTPNPSGNFTKITQRVPVRIAVAQHEGKLRPGTMVEVKIATGG